MRLLSLASLVSVGVFLSGTQKSDGFIPSSRSAARQAKTGGMTLTRQYMAPSTRESEKELRQEIANRNSKVENEEQYAIKDGTGLETTITTEENKDETDAAKEEMTVAASSVTEESSALQKKLDRLIQQRPYALFLMEKGFEIVEDLVEDVFGSEKSSFNSMKREKVVVLGTGWGAAAFLKGIDTSLYDVTVISPRNYFVFTPMLAGASVGTVDYRSITEPVREVRTLRWRSWKEFLCIS
jgi:hypothetical protein